MKRKIWRAVGAFAVFAGIGLAAAVPVKAINIVGGVPETNGPEACDPNCNKPAGFTGPGIPTNVRGYVAVDVPTGTSAVMSLVLPTAQLIRFEYLGSDAGFRNQFYVDRNGNGNPFDAGDLVFDNTILANTSPLVIALPAGTLHFGYRYDVNGANVAVPGDPSTTFNILAACSPAAGNPAPRTCDDGYIGFADGTIFVPPGGVSANDDHQDLGVRFSAVPEPASLLLFGFGLIGAAYARRRKIAAE